MRELSFERYIRLFVVLFLVFAAQGVATSYGGEVSVPLLAAPINATWAANHGEAWQEKGVGGFLFQGIMDDLRLYPSERDALASAAAQADIADYAAESLATTPTLRARPIRFSPDAATLPGDWDALTREIAGAANRLRACGVDRNFLHMRLSPEADWFVNETMGDIAERRFAMAGAFCAGTGLRGIALDTQSDSALFDYRWDGYAPDQDADALASGTHRFAVRVLRAYYRAHPEGEVLLLANRPESAGPLWFSFMDGAFTSIGSAAIPLRVVFQGEADLLVPEAFRARVGAMDRLFKQRLSPSAYHCWQRQGGAVFGLEPIAYRGDIPTARYPLENYRAALHAAALHGRDYVLLLAPEGGWWHIPPDTAAQFTHLRQGGRARVSYAPPMPRALDAFMPRIHFKDAVSVGTFNMHGANAEVLRNDKGAALVFWDALEQGFEVATRRGMIATTHLATDEQRFFTPRDGRITLPPLNGPVFIEGLSMRDFALPASIWLAPSDVFTAGITRGVLRFGLDNPLAAPLRGTLNLVTAGRYALGTAAFPIRLGPGESSEFQRTVQGLSYLGQRPRFEMALTVTAEAPVQRTFDMTVEPELHDRLIADGPLVGPPIPGNPLPHYSMPLFFLLDRRGGLHYHDSATGTTLWRKRLRGGFQLPAVALRDGGGAAYVAVVNNHGRIRIFDATGNERALILPERADDIVGAATLVDAKRSKTGVVVAMGAGRLLWYTASGQLLWSIETLRPIRGILTDPALPGRLYVHGAVEEEAAGGKTSPVMYMACYDHQGGPIWDTGLATPIAYGPILHGAATPASSVLCVADNQGKIICHNAETGVRTGEDQGEDAEPPTALLAFQARDTARNWVVSATRTSAALRPLHVSDESDDENDRGWSRRMPECTALAVLLNQDGVALGTADGAVYAFDLEGKLLWESHQGACPVTSLVLFPDPDTLNAYYCAVSTNDHVTRILHIRGDLIIPAHVEM